MNPSNPVRNIEFVSIMKIGSGVWPSASAVQIEGGQTNLQTVVSKIKLTSVGQLRNFK